MSHNPRHARCFHILAWLLACAALVERADRAYRAYDDPRRADGNAGHVQIDFGGQWVMGRTVALGHVRQLYNRNVQWPIVRAAFPQKAEPDWVQANNFPKEPQVKPFSDDDPRHDAEWLMYWFMGSDSPRWQTVGSAVALPFAQFPSPWSAMASTLLANETASPELLAEVSRKAVGGALYPPVHAFAMAPLGCISDPQRAYRVMQAILLFALVLAARGLSRITDGRISWPVAIAFLAYFTGCRTSLELGQNSAISLTILVWGWLCLTRNRDILGGLIWGLLVYKPLWGATFFLVPLMMGRWRFCATMVLTGGGLAAATLPFCGVEVWKDWLAVGKEASELYRVNRNWLFLSRDLFGLPSRVLLDFSLPESQRDRTDAAILGWLLWAIVFIGTVATFLRSTDRRALGFALLGAYLCCYRFIYYDALLAAFPLVVLISVPNEVARTRWPSFPVFVVSALLMLENFFVQWNFYLAGTNLNSGVRYPWDTLMLLALWLWLLVRLHRG